MIRRKPRKTNYTIIQKLNCIWLYRKQILLVVADAQNKERYHLTKSNPKGRKLDFRLPLVNQ